MNAKTIAILKLSGMTRLTETEMLRSDMLETAKSCNAAAETVVKKMDIGSIQAKIEQAVADIFEEDELKAAIEFCDSEAYQHITAAKELLENVANEGLKSELMRVVESLGDKGLLEQTSAACRSLPKEKASGLTPGSRVLLGRHDTDADGEDNWASTMDPFVGKEAKIVKIIGFDENGYEVAKVDIDEKRHAWRTRNMRRVTSMPNFGHEAEGSCRK